uniref:Secreted protein n=1 Tax=Physcomitrium patens TaxID=3218 RepID=A0A7I4AND3_PHYPA
MPLVVFAAPIGILHLLKTCCGIQVSFGDVHAICVAPACSGKVQSSALILRAPENISFFSATQMRSLGLLSSEPPQFCS